MRLRSSFANAATAVAASSSPSNPLASLFPNVSQCVGGENCIFPFQPNRDSRGISPSFLLHHRWAM
jgi:hypothetical protein